MQFYVNSSENGNDSFCFFFFFFFAKAHEMALSFESYIFHHWLVLVYRCCKSNIISQFYRIRPTSACLFLPILIHSSCYHIQIWPWKFEILYFVHMKIRLIFCMSYIIQHFSAAKPDIHLSKSSSSSNHDLLNQVCIQLSTCRCRVQTTGWNLSTCFFKNVNIQIFITKFQIHYLSIAQPAFQ